MSDREREGDLPTSRSALLITIALSAKLKSMQSDDDFGIDSNQVEKL